MKDARDGDEGEVSDHDRRGGVAEAANFPMPRGGATAIRDGAKAARGLGRATDEEERENAELCIVEVWCDKNGEI